MLYWHNCASLTGMSFEDELFDWKRVTAYIWKLYLLQCPFCCFLHVFRTCCRKKLTRWWSGLLGARSSGWMGTSSDVMSRLHPGTTLSSSCSQLCNLKGSALSAGMQVHTWIQGHYYCPYPCLTHPIPNVLFIWSSMIRKVTILFF